MTPTLPSFWALVPDEAIRWVLTYLVHSTVLWVLARAIGSRLRHLANEELLWRAALLTGLLSASLQSVLGHAAGTLAVDLPWLAQASAGPASVSVRGTVEGGLWNDPALVASWLGLGLLGLLTLFFWIRPAIAWFRFRQRLTGRLVLKTGLVREELDALLEDCGTRRRVILSRSRRLSVPLAFGHWRPEICLPETTLEQLSTQEVRSVLAHELAHVVRRDPLWRWVTAWLEDLLFFQPLNRLTGRRLVRLSELLSDDWARQHTSARSLAHCLVSVASSLPRTLRRPTVASTMASGQSELVERVRRLAKDTPSTGLSRHNPALGLYLVAAALLVTTTIPGLEPPSSTPAELWVVSTTRPTLTQPARLSEPVSVVAPAPGVESPEIELDLEVDALSPSPGRLTVQPRVPDPSVPAPEVPDLDVTAPDITDPDVATPELSMEPPLRVSVEPVGPD